MKVLIVDDSALMRRYLAEIIEADGRCTAAIARNGVEALSMLETFDPDVITLDVNMPEMDGLTCLANIMSLKPKPVIMVSSITEEGAEVTLEALALGAVDFIQKPGGTISLNVGRIQSELRAKVQSAARARLRRSAGLANRLRAQRREVAAPRREPVSARSAGAGGEGVVVIGVSTGGPNVLEEILTSLDADFAWPVVVAQHMPGSFTGVFANRLNAECRVEVLEAAVQTTLEAGKVFIAKGDADIIISRRQGRVVVTPMPQSSSYTWHPSVERLVESAMSCFEADRIIGVMLTGMGNDGAEAMAELKRRGGRTIAQDEATCVVFGMPGELVKRGGASVVLPDTAITRQLTEWVGTTAVRGEKRLGAR